MVITDKIVLRQLAERQWRRPEDGLARAGVVRMFSDVAPEIGGSRTWRKEPFKKYLEDSQAALFVYGLKQALPHDDWQYSSGEMPSYNREADCFVRCRVDREFLYKPVQLKEVVPAEWPGSGPQQVIDRLANKYTAAAGRQMLVVAIHVNRVMTINFKELRVPPICTSSSFGFTVRQTR